MEYLRDHAIPSALALLPGKMDTPAARAMLLAIADQESGYYTRFQLRGPARGYWMFERPGLAGVLTHPATAPLVTDVLLTLRYTRDLDDLFAAVAHNDVLAAAFARLLLWTSRMPLPRPTDTDQAWHLYTETWKPGAVSHSDPQRAIDARARWDSAFAMGWQAVTV